MGHYSDYRDIETQKELTAIKDDLIWHLENKLDHDMEGMSLLLKIAKNMNDYKIFFKIIKSN